MRAGVNFPAFCYMLYQFLSLYVANHLAIDVFVLLFSNFSHHEINDSNTNLSTSGLKGWEIIDGVGLIT